MMETPGDGAGDSTMAHGLAQQAREKQLKTARVILIIVGILTILANGFFYFGAEKEVDTAMHEEARKVHGAGYQIADKELWESEKAKAVKLTRLIYGGGLVLGVVFIICAMLVYRAPVAATVTGLVLYIAGWLGPAAIDPKLIFHGILIKIIIIVCLVKAVQAAIAYQKARQLETLAASSPAI